LLYWHNLAVAFVAPSRASHVMTDHLLALNPRGALGAERACVRRLPYTVEHVASGDAGFDFAWSGESAYLALHDIVLRDGGMAGDDVTPVRLLDMRRRMTFLPHGVRVNGWCEPVARSNAFSVLYFDQDWLFDELEVSPSRRSLHPMVYFQSGELMNTMTKLARLAQATERTPQILMDSHVIAAGAELLKAVATDTDEGRLTDAQLCGVRDYVDAHLADDISVADLAALTGLSVFHFTRKFKTTIGVAPYQYVLEARVERAKALIQTSALPLATIAEMTGFSSPSHFSRTFTEIVGASPSAFRRSRRL
jgi:AraC family transcriptional regulator